MKRSKSVASLGGALCVLAVAVEAQEVQGTGLTLEEITVTARRREETLQEVPVAVTAFTETAVEELDIEDLGDLDAFVPNLTIYAARGSDRKSVV